VTQRGRALVTPGWDVPFKAAAGGRLRELRTERGWSQDELARRAGMSQATLSNIERGETQPFPATQRALAAALEMDARDLIVRLSGDPHAR
jgi:transcriptional regulator with XRE-family HTH domain